VKVKEFKQTHVENNILQKQLCILLKANRIMQQQNILINLI